MSLEKFSDSIPQFARDIRVNLGNVLKQAELTPAQLWGTAVASAITTRNRLAIQAMEEEGAKHVSAEILEAARTAASIMAMNNVYYRFLHLVETPERYGNIPARLRMQGLRTHGTDQTDFELWCTAVSAINNCPACVASHERVVREKGLTEEQVAAAVRIAAVINAAAMAIEQQTA